MWTSVLSEFQKWKMRLKTCTFKNSDSGRPLLATLSSSAAYWRQSKAWSWPGINWKRLRHTHTHLCMCVCVCNIRICNMHIYVYVCKHVYFNFFCSEAPLRFCWINTANRFTWKGHICACANTRARARRAALRAGVERRSRKRELWHQTTWAQPLSTLISMGRYLNPSELPFSHLWSGVIVPRGVFLTIK